MKLADLAARQGPEIRPTPQLFEALAHLVLKAFVIALRKCSGTLVPSSNGGERYTQSSRELTETSARSVGGSMTAGG
jgi:hypothetical protein